MTPLLVQEYEQVTGVRLSAADLDALLDAGAGIAVDPQRGAEGTWTVRASSFVGVVATPTLVVRIRPKLPVARLFTMLSAATDKIEWDEARAGFAEDACVEDVVATAFCDAVADRLATGLLRGYQTVEEEAAVVRGKLDLAQTLRRNPLSCFPVVQRPEFLVEDIVENRVLAAALRVLARVVTSVSLRTRLHGLMQAFVDVGPLEGRGRLPVLRRTRLNARWWATLDLAMLVLRGGGMALPDGQRTARAFVVDMNQVFERFVFRALADELSSRGLRLQHNVETVSLDADGHHSLRPDLSIADGSRYVFVGDCKYKTTDQLVPGRSDLYQSLAYATAMGVGRVLVYYGDDHVVSRDVALVDGRTVVGVRGLPLGGDVDELRRRIGGLAGEIAGLAGALGLAGAKSAAAIAANAISG